MGNKIKCSHILVQKQSEALAILERIKKGEKFGKLAKELSIDSGSAKKDGNLGYFTRGMMVKPFEEIAFKLEIRNKNDKIYKKPRPETYTLHNLQGLLSVFPFFDF